LSRHDIRFNFTGGVDGNKQSGFPVVVVVIFVGRATEFHLYISTFNNPEFPRPTNKNSSKLLLLLIKTVDTTIGKSTLENPTENPSNQIPPFICWLTKEHKQTRMDKKKILKSKKINIYQR
jgi:hypothetical protein